MSGGPWLVPAPDPAAPARLYLFAHAGGAASGYRAWPALAGGALEVHRVQYPGRENRFREAPLDRVEALADGVAEAMLYDDDPRPQVLFGHSMGALVAAETALRLSRAGRPPALLIVSACRTPGLPRPWTPINALPDRELVAALRESDDAGATDALDDPDLAELLLPAIRADLRAVEEYRGPSVPPLERTPLDGPPLDCPVLAWSGARDEGCGPADMAGWGALTTGPFEQSVFPGGHFYLRPAEADVVRQVRSAALHRCAAPVA